VSASQVPDGVGFFDDYEVLVVETPENLELRLPLAGFGPRLVAQLVDNAILFAVVMAAILVLAVAAGLLVRGGGGALVVVIGIIALVVFAMFGYWALFEGFWNGQTPGKRVAGIRVIRRGGLPLTAREVVLRNLFRLVDMFPSYGFVGVVSFFATKHQQRLGDLVADTVVVREFRPGSAVGWQPFDERSLARSGALSPDLTYVIGAYLARRWELPVEVKLAVTEDAIRAIGYDARLMTLADREGYLAYLLNWQAGGGR